MSDAGADDAAPTTAVVIDFLPRGRPEDDRPQYQKSPVAFAVGEEDFRLVEIALTDDAGVNIGDRVEIDPPGENVKTLRDVAYDALSSTAESELEYAVNEIIDGDERRFVDFYNDAQPITTRLHVLNLLPGIGKKLRNNVLDERKRKPFESFEEIEERVSGLHKPREVLVERILEEIREDDLKYRIFARRDDE
jgi:putative nucleotide binding protein